MALAPLYSITSSPVTITVAAPGAAVDATSFPVDTLTVGVPAGVILDFGSSKFAKVVTAAAPGDEEIDVGALAKALVAGDTTTYAPPLANPLLSASYKALDADEQLAHHILAELLLDLRAPIYTDTDGEEMSYAIVRQINFQVKHGITPDMVRASSNSRSGVTENYRDRYLDPGAWAIVARIDEREAVEFNAPGVGV
jgi:hypothetical protein